MIEKLKLKLGIPFVKKNEHGNLMTVNSRFELRRLREKEPETVQWIKESMKSGEVFYDVGANVGQYSFLAESCGARVYAFEPSATTFSSLVKNKFLNRSSITIFPIALSDKTEIGLLGYSSLEEGASNHSWKDSKRKFLDSILSYRLDDFINEFKLPLPRHIKLDVDGYELLVLEGAKETIKSVASLMVEIDEKKDFQKVYRLLSDFELISKVDRGKGIYNCFFAKVIHSPDR